MMVRDFQSVIGREAREQCIDSFGRLPDRVVACVGGGSNAAGMFYPFVEDEGVEMIGVEAGGRGNKPGDHASPLSYGSPASCMAVSAMSCKTKTGRPVMSIR